jgi:hypothetical protein
MHKHRSAEDILVGARLRFFDDLPALSSGSRMTLLAAVHPRSHAALRPLNLG